MILDFSVETIRESHTFADITRLQSSGLQWLKQHQIASLLLFCLMVVLATLPPRMVSTIWTWFTPDRFSTLAGKPKLFFIQACQGYKLDNGVTLHHNTLTDSKSTEMSFSIPLYADFLIVYATFPGHKAWRTAEYGSWFIQILCSELDKHGEEYDILILPTVATQRFALDFVSNVPIDYLGVTRMKI